MSKQPLCALVTGATRGIGYAISEKLQKEGIKVIGTGTKKNGKVPDGVSYRQVDFLDDESFYDFVEYISGSDVDILVNNAGINKIGEFGSINIDDFDNILKVNLRSPFILCQCVIPNMKKNMWGRIINISSIFGYISKEYRAAYSSSKFGLDGMTVALSAELSQYGILANCIGPGFIDTELTREILGDKCIEDLKDKIPQKRLGKVDEIAELTAWLVSKKNSYITGQNIIIDGGFTRV